jgi:alkylation response protein AidB-like acyl-CoA dehydrogenase
VPHFLTLFHSAFAVGVAEGALDDLLAVADSGRQQQRAAVPMRESEIFQFELGQIAAELRAARACLEAQAVSHWRHALAGTLKNEARLIEGAQTGAWIFGTCVHAADACFTLAGGSAVYDRSPLQRRMRDLHVAAQHATINRRHYAAAGKAALAQFRGQFDRRQPLAAE